jgi:hypothetical protein
MLKRIEDLSPGDLVEVKEPNGVARVVLVSDRKLLPAFFEHCAGRDARTVDLVMMDDPTVKLAAQYHKDDKVAVLE